MKMFKNQPAVTAGDLIFAKNTPEYQNHTFESRNTNKDPIAKTVSRLPP